MLAGRRSANHNGHLQDHNRELRAPQTQTAVPCVKELQKIESLPSTNLTPNDPIRPVTQSCFQQVAHCDGRYAVLLPARFESKNIVFLNLYLCRLNTCSFKILTAWSTP